MSYKCLNNQTFENGSYLIIPIRKSDMELIRQWRNEQISVLRQNFLITEEEQKAYYKNVIEPSFAEKHPHQILFSFLKNGQIIGYGGLTNINWVSKRAEVSFLLDTKRIEDKKSYRRVFVAFFEIIKKVAFDNLKFHRLYTETYDIRPFHIFLIEEQGFILEGRCKDHVLIDNRYCDSLIHGLINKDSFVK